MSEVSEAKISVQFVLNVLRQHEIELDKLIEELLTNKVDKLTNKMQNMVNTSSTKS